MNSGIYKITNIKTGMCYIGQTCNFKRRHKEHLQELRHGKHINKRLQHSFNKHGEDSFIFSIVEECPMSQLNDREVFWIEYFDSYNSGYNLNEGGDVIRGSKKKTNEFYMMTDEFMKLFDDFTSSWVSKSDKYWEPQADGKKIGGVLYSIYQCEIAELLEYLDKPCDMLCEPCKCMLKHKKFNCLLREFDNCDEYHWCPARLFDGHLNCNSKIEYERELRHQLWDFLLHYDI